jgi:hypothetical protein
MRAVPQNELLRQVFTSRLGKTISHLSTLDELISVKNILMKNYELSNFATLDSLEPWILNLLIAPYS